MRWVWSLVTLAAVPGRLRLACFLSVGLCVGMGLFVVHISEASSYLSDNPETCINCHIMVPEYASWRHSSHGRVTNCNDCHVPHTSALAKYYFKAKDGSRHSALFMLRRERQVIVAIPESRRVIQENCVRCHARVFESPRVHARTERPCIDCHREVPHGRQHSLSSTPNAAVPPLGASVLPLTERYGNAEGGR
ncbi:MAG: cytochrome c nitrite reductase small subunit [Armatimonadetes bacterium]|nr:cytochrome c nitrite reductase small subunit [Armatimonadota bacterium]